MAERAARPVLQKDFSNRVLDSFWKNVNRGRDDECWPWRDGSYRGSVSIRGRGVCAPRVSWVIHNGDIASGKFICHTCDNPSCVNPKHLFVGDHEENMRDMVRKGRKKSTHRAPDADGWRAIRTKLQLYLDSHNLTQLDFADMIAARIRATFHQPMVNRWCVGRRKPSRIYRKIISELTSGFVGESDW